MKKLWKRLLTLVIALVMVAGIFHLTPALASIVVLPVGQSRIQLLPTYSDIEFTDFVIDLTNNLIAEAGAVTPVEKLRAVYDFVSMQFRHTHPRSTSGRGSAVDGSLAPHWSNVPFPDGFADTRNMMGAPSGIARIAHDTGTRTTRGDIIVLSWEMLYGLYACPHNYAALFTVMTGVLGFDTRIFDFYMQEANGQFTPQVYTKIRLNGDWYIFHPQRESFTNNTERVRHNYFFLPVADTNVQELFVLCDDALELLAELPPMAWATILAADTSAFATSSQAPTVTAPATAENRILRFPIGSTTFTNNGISQTLEAAPFIADGRTMVPLRVIAEALGATNLDMTNNVVTFDIAGQHFSMTISQELPGGFGTPVIREGRTFVPLGFIIHTLDGAEARWDGATGQGVAYIYIS